MSNVRGTKMIRTATKEDIPLLLKWLESLISHTQVSTDDPYINNLEPDYDKAHQPFFLDAIKNSKGQIYIFEEEGVQKGFIYGAITKPFLEASSIKSIGQINFCWVDAIYRKQGIASELVQSMEKWFKSKDIEYIDLHYLVGNIEAEESWKKMGYSPYRVVSRKEL
jgi:GNAT superfamily N-acetyltransferase